MYTVSNPVGTNLFTISLMALEINYKMANNNYMKAVCHLF